MVKNNCGRFSLPELEKNNARVEYVEMKLTLEERETTISFNEKDANAEIATFSNSWITRLENLGHRPREVYFYENAEVRFYDVPKSQIPLPKAKRKISPAQRRRLSDQLVRAREAQKG